MKKNLQIVTIFIFLIYCVKILPYAEKPLQEFRNYCRTQNIMYVEYLFIDFLGNIRSVIRPAEYAEKDLTDGISFDGSSIPGGSHIVESDMLLQPDLDAMTNVPWSNGPTKTIRINCTMYKDKDVPYESDPRYILQKVVNEATQMGYTFYVGPELEFYLCNFKDNQLIPYDNTSYFSASTNYHDDQIRANLLNILRASGINIEKIHHEVSPGQYEVSIHYGSPVKIADHIMITKHTLKSLEDETIKTTFMPKPLAHQNGSGMHIHFSLFDREEKQNIFYDSSHPYLLSNVAQSFIAGVLHHARALTLLFNCTINSYKRLIPKHEAPTFVCCGIKNRSSLIRLPQINKNQPDTVRAELRSPDPLCNPYLAFAGLLKAGLDGIKNNMKLPTIINTNLYELSPEEAEKTGIERLPKSLEEAIEAYKESSLLHELLGDKLFQDYLQAKIKELADFSLNINNWELIRYF